MMNCSQTVHYDETRNICHMADKSIQKVDESVVKEPLKLDMPVKYSDAAYSTYDIFTAASLGDVESVRVIVTFYFFCLQELFCPLRLRLSFFSRS